MHLLRFVLRMRHLVGKNSSSPSPPYLVSPTELKNLQILQSWVEVPDSTFTATKDEETVRLSPSFSGRGFYRVVVD